jgi:oligosaccharyltransferase complex subunit epsilon
LFRVQVLTASLRTQCDPATKHEFAGISEERAYADYVVCAVILFPVVWNFMG